MQIVVHIKLCPQGPDNLAAEAPALRMRRLWALSAAAMITWLWHTGAQRHVSIHPPGPALGFMVLGWQLVPAWCHPMGVPGEGTEAMGCLRGNGGGKGIAGN